MKKALTKKTELYHYKNGVRIKGANKNMSGKCDGLWGEIRIEGEIVVRQSLF